MKIRGFVLVISLLFIVQGFAFADRQLDDIEINQILQLLTTTEVKETWIPMGIIEAKHQEYNPSEGYLINSSVIVKYDGDKFYWEINMDSYDELAGSRGNDSGLNLSTSAKRVFAWDGSRYTMYFKSGNKAVVTEKVGSMPVAVNGPLTAGIVPWGYGIYTLEGLLSAKPSAIEKDVDGNKQVHLTLSREISGLLLEIVFVLDSTKDYAVLSWSMDNGGYTSIVKTYADHQQISGKWIPTTIAIERYDNRKQLPELLSYDTWTFTSVDVSSPQSDSFNIAYETDALIEYDSSVTSVPLLYHHSSKVDTESLLHDKLAIAATYNPQTQNCATTAMKYVLSQLDRDIDDQQLALLIEGSDKHTSLYTLRQFARQLGLYSTAVKTDIQTLKDLEGAQAILHIPTSNHYVVLGAIDDKHIGLIDLNSNKFYYRTKLDDFDSNWKDGTALLISKSPLLLAGNLTEINDENLQSIIGSNESGIGNYSCYFTCCDRRRRR